MSTDRTTDFAAADFADDPERFARERASVQKNFWRKLKQVAAKIPFAEDLLSAYYCAFDRTTPRHVQVALIGALAYFVLPFDFMPDILPLVGFTDDAAVLAAAIASVRAYLGADHYQKAREALQKLAA